MDMSWADGVERVAVLTGAGISTDSGIPDYRGPSGVWTRDPGLVDAFTYPAFLADAQVRAAFWRTYRGHAAWRAEPNAAHRALAGLEHDGVAVRILTQNVDGLHQKAGSTARKVLELHGSIRETVCTGCAVRAPSAPTMTRVAAGDLDPRCAACGGILQLAVVLFGQHLDPETVGLAERIAAHSQLLVVVGSSLLVEPVASLCAVAVNAGHRLVIINRDPTPMTTWPQRCSGNRSAPPCRSCGKRWPADRYGPEEQCSAGRPGTAVFRRPAVSRWGRRNRSGRRPGLGPGLRRRRP